MTCIVVLVVRFFFRSLFTLDSSSFLSPSMKCLCSFTPDRMAARNTLNGIHISEGVGNEAQHSARFKLNAMLLIFNFSHVENICIFLLGDFGIPNIKKTWKKVSTAKYYSKNTKGIYFTFPLNKSREKKLYFLVNLIHVFVLRLNMISQLT